jgi:hypothetical protein
VRYESNNPGPVQLAFLNDKRCVGYTERKREIGGAGAAQPGEVLALLTWQQRADPNWFGARIPGALQSLELLRTGHAGAGHPAVTYQCFTGKNLTLLADTAHQQERIAYLLAQKPAVLL